MRADHFMTCFAEPGDCWLGSAIWQCKIHEREHSPKSFLSFWSGYGVLITEAVQSKCVHTWWNLAANGIQIPTK